MSSIKDIIVAMKGLQGVPCGRIDETKTAPHMNSPSPTTGLVSIATSDASRGIDLSKADPSLSFSRERKSSKRGHGEGKPFGMDLREEQEGNWQCGS